MTSIRDAAAMGHERGETTAQLAVLVPIVFAVFLVGVHLASYAYASHVANVAALRGAQRASAQATTAVGIVAGLSEIERVTHELGSTLVVAPRVMLEGDSVRAQVSLKVAKVVPFLPHIVTRTAWAAREDFLRSQDR